MRAMCIENRFKEPGKEFKLYNGDTLKVGEIYELVENDRTWGDRTKMINVDIGGYRLQYPKSWFIPLDEWRDKQINKIIDE